MFVYGIGADGSTGIFGTTTGLVEKFGAKRVFDTLAHWIGLDDAALDREMRAIGETAIGPARRARARRLFASALDTPGGLKVQTIHAFCTRLLHQFPFEANVPARFTVLDERAESELVDRATFSVLLDAARAPGTPLANALATAILLFLSDENLAARCAENGLRYAREHFCFDRMMRAKLDVDLSLVKSGLGGRQSAREGRPLTALTPVPDVEAVVPD